MHGVQGNVRNLQTGHTDRNRHGFISKTSRVRIVKYNHIGGQRHQTGCGIIGHALGGHGHALQLRGSHNRAQIHLYPTACAGAWYGDAPLAVAEQVANIRAVVQVKGCQLVIVAVNLRQRGICTDVQRCQLVVIAVKSLQRCIFADIQRR